MATMSNKEKKPRAEKPITDERFASVQYDPRFQRFPKAKAKVEIDDRFAGMFTDPAFQVRSATTDKRGRKVKPSKGNDDISKYYRIRNEARQEEAPPQKGSSAEEEIVDASMEAHHNERWARLRGITGPETSSEEEAIVSDEVLSDAEQYLEENEEEEGDDDLEADLEADVAEWGIGALAANPQETIPLLENATHRLAVVDLDWDYIRAADIFAVLQSFAPKGGHVLKVTVYPSDYGLERMKEEATLGPRGIWKGQRRLPAELFEHINANAATALETEKDNQEEEEEEEEEEAAAEIDQERLQKYERSRLRYYYAVVECDTVFTANALYEECDGMEFMKTACKFDLRFIPDDTSFESRIVRDMAKDIPSDYAPPVFQTKALQHTHVQLTWDNGDENRKRALSKKLNADELKEDDFKAYLATSSGGEMSSEDEAEKDDNDQDEETVRRRYLSLLDASNTIGDKEGVNDVRKGRKDFSSKDVDMEVTFAPGLESLGERILAKKKDEALRKGETVWDSYLRRKREKKAEAIRLGKHTIGSSDDDVSDGGVTSDGDGIPEDVEDDPFFAQDENPFEDPFFTSTNETGRGMDTLRENKKNVRVNKKEDILDDEKKKRAELEMLILDEKHLLTETAHASKHEDAHSNPSKKVSIREKMKQKRRARRKEREEGSGDEADGEDFKADLSDPRFSKLFTSAEFALDPTDPRFGKTGDSAVAIASAVAKKRCRDKTDRLKEQSKGERTRGDSDVKLMVASLKRRQMRADKNDDNKKNRS